MALPKWRDWKATSASKRRCAFFLSMAQPIEPDVYQSAEKFMDDCMNHIEMMTEFTNRLFSIVKTSSLMNDEIAQSLYMDCSKLKQVNDLWLQQTELDEFLILMVVNCGVDLGMALSNFDVTVLKQIQEQDSSAATPEDSFLKQFNTSYPKQTQQRSFGLNEQPQSFYQSLNDQYSNQPSNQSFYQSTTAQGSYPCIPSYIRADASSMPCSMNRTLDHQEKRFSDHHRFSSPYRSDFQNPMALFPSTKNQKSQFHRYLNQIGTENDQLKRASDQSLENKENQMIEDMERLSAQQQQQEEQSLEHEQQKILEAKEQQELDLALQQSAKDYELVRDQDERILELVKKKSLLDMNKPRKNLGDLPVQIYLDRLTKREDFAGTNNISDNLYDKKGNLLANSASDNLVNSDEDEWDIVSYGK